MEDPGTSGPESVASPPAGASKSKLDTLSKEDLIKFAKKQMAAMQKMKSKCAVFEKEVETLKQQVKSSNSSSEDSILIQELTERMDALLLEKAETQQSLVLSRKELERNKLQAKDMAALQAELDSVKEDHQRKIRALESSIEESNIRHQDEVARFQNLLTEREQRDREEASEREKRPSNQGQRTDDDDDGAESSEEAQRRCLEVELQSLRAQLELIQEGKSKEVCELQESRQQELTLAQQEVENLREELAQSRLQHDEEMRTLEEDCEVERERLLLLHDELTEQLALKDSYLQDVQEEDEDPARGSGIARMLELSRSSQGALVQGDADALEDLQAQNTMFQDELTLLSNVKAELEAELQRTREEFQTEREELEFKIDELQMCREGDPATAASGPPNFDPADQQKSSGPEEQQSASSHPDQDQQKSSSPEEQQKLQELRAQCEALAGERDSALAEHRHTVEVLRGLETELGVTAGEDLVCRYKAVKEEGTSALRDLREKIQELGQERDGLVDRVGEITEESTHLTEKIQALELKLEGSRGETRAAEDLKQKLQASLEEQKMLVGELKASVDELTGRNEEILSQLQMKETLAQELEETAGTLTTERDRMQSQLRLREDEVDRLNRLQQDKEREVDGIREELENQRKERELLIEERRKMADDLKAETGDWEERVDSLKLTIKEMSSEKADLARKVEEASAALSLAQEERQRLDSELASLGPQLERESSEKRDLEARLEALSEEARQAQASVRALEESSQAEEALRSSADDVQDLRARVEELESERDLLKSSLEEAQGQGRLDEMPVELQARMEELQKEKSLLEGELEEVVGDTEALQKDLEDMKTANEKLRAENQELQAKVSLAVQDKEEEEESKEQQRRRRETEEQLTEKEALIVQLRSEMAALQAAPSEENVASQFTEKIALLEKELKGKDERMNKIRAVAVKAKKELDANKKEVASLKEEVELLKVERERVSSSMKDIIHGAEGYKNLQMDHDRQTEQLDKQREMAEAAERQIAELTKRLSTAVTQNETLFGEKQDLLAGMDTMRSTVRQLEAQCQELHRHTASLDRDLLAERATREHKAKELSSSMKEVEELTARLRKQQQQSQQTAQELEQLRKEAQQSSLMDMEMADYERLVKELNAKMSDKDACVEELKAQIHTHTQRENTLQQDIEGLKSQLDQGEEKMSKMKQLLVKTKKDLADAKKQEASHVVLHASLKGELEANLQQLESSKIQLCEVTAECHRLQEQLRCVTEQQHRSSSSLQQCISSLQQECDTAKAELASTTAEFESYKVRVHNVLKQQKNKSSSQSDGEPGKLEREQLSEQVEQLRARLSEGQQSLQSGAAELQQLHAEHDTLLDRHNKMLQENICKEAELRERLLAVQSENVGLRAEQAQVQASLQGQAEAQRQAFREQVRRLQDEHRSTVDTLQGQLGRLEEQLFTMQSHNGSGQVQSGRKDPQQQQQQQRSRNPAEQSPAGGLGFMSVGDLQSMAREEGEGMETTETERSSPAHTPLPSLEQLLTSPDPKQEPFVWALEPTKEELSHKLTTATRSMEHMNSLLHETEATNAVLMEQITLLKSEVRRLERNQEREKSVANLEYLKNVLLQFIFLHSGSERQALLPVIHTMLQLSPEEKSKLAAIAHGEEETSGSRGSGWSSYLHSWSGIR